MEINFWIVHSSNILSPTISGDELNGSKCASCKSKLVPNSCAVIFKFVPFNF